MTLWLLWIAAACTAAVLVHQRWPRLMLPAFALTSVQWGEWLDGGRPQGAALLVLAGFGAVTIVSAAGDTVRTSSPRLARRGGGAPVPQRAGADPSRGSPLSTVPWPTDGSPLWPLCTWRRARPAARA
ncbi:MAG: hypothetical protein MSC31_08115 [Solirubrobacteraceae bacterium MAG38_C4-C5]|nr:hypothetical protein [Candidatus Siliceabacter maunaloa]